MLLGKKFSQLRQSATNVTGSDFIVGVQNGTDDVLYTSSQINQLTITRAQIPSQNLGSSSTFMVSGFSVPGDAGTGAIYTSIGATAGGPLAIQDSAGTWFNLVVDNTVNVGWFGALGDGMNDDRPAIQNAIDVLANKGGGAIEFLASATHLLNSYSNSLTNGDFHYNLIAGSNISFVGSGATLLQGVSGRAIKVPASPSVVNAVLVFGEKSTWPNITFQDPTVNGGFYSLNAITLNQSYVTLTTASDASNFSQGDLVGIYSTTIGDVILSEMSEVIAVDVVTGVLTLKWHLARSMATPSIANVTSLAITNVSLTDITLHGAIPLSLLQCFNVESEGVNYITDTSIGGGNILGLYENTVRGLSSEVDSYSSVGSGIVDIQLPQRNSYDISYTNCTFEANSLGFGEFATHWSLQGNIINIFGPNGMLISGLDILLEGNSIYAADVTAGGGSGAILEDNAGPTDLPYSGQIRIVHNVIVGAATGNSGIRIVTPDAVVASNVIFLSGNALGIKVESPLAQAVQIVENNITLGTTGTIGIWINNNVSPDGCTIVGNNVVGSGAGSVGIYVHTGTGIPKTGGHTISSNSVNNFTFPIFVESVESPGTLVVDKTNLILPAGCFIEGTEQAAPAAPPANGYRIFAQDNGAGKTQLMVIFSTGAAQQIAIQPP